MQLRFPGSNGFSRSDKLAAMRSVHLVIPDLFPPEDFAVEACAGLRLPALERMLARGVSTGSGPSIGSGRTERDSSLEALLCELFGVSCQGGAPVAPISAAFDGLGKGCWLRADPAHLRLQRDRLILLPEVEAKADEAVQMCSSLNEHFAGQGVAFLAPHPQRWYVRVDRLPDIETVPLSRAAGRNVRDLLSGGKEAAHWRRMFNEIQMLLFSHPANEAREARGELPVNCLWLWGGGCSPAVPVQKVCDSVSSDEELAEMFAAAADIPFAGWPGRWRNEGGDRQLLVWTGLRSALRRGDPEAWRAALRDFETGCAQPLWQALRAGSIAQFQVDIPGGDGIRRMSLGRADAWAFWRRVRPFAECSMMQGAVTRMA